MSNKVKRAYWGHQVAKVVHAVLGYEQSTHQENPNYTFLMWRIPLKLNQSCEWLATRLTNALNIDLKDHELKCRLRLDVTPGIVREEMKWVHVKISIFENPLVQPKGQ